MGFNSGFKGLNSKNNIILPVMNFLCFSEYRRGLAVLLNGIQRLLSVPEAKCVLRSKRTGFVKGI